MSNQTNGGNPTDAVILTGTILAPIGEVPNFGVGQASGTHNSMGNMKVQTVPAGVGNAAVTTDTVLFTFALPAFALDNAGRQVTINFSGATGATANNKQWKIWWGTTSQTVGSPVAGGTLICGSGVQTGNAQAISASVNVNKYGVLGSNTQFAWGSQAIQGLTHLGTTAGVSLTAAENAVINITVTGASSTTGAANDVLGQSFEVTFSN